MDQFKRQIRKWKLDKKKKESEMRMIANLFLQRNKINKRSIIIVRNRRYKLQDVIRYFERKGISIEDLDPSRVPAAATSVRCLTPVPPSLESPAELGTTERVLFSTRAFAQGYFNSSTRPSKQTQDWHPTSTAHLMTEFVTGLDLAGALFSCKDYHEGGQALIAVTAYIEDLVRACNPFVLSHLSIVLQRNFSTSKELALIMLKQFESMTKRVFHDQNHPLTAIFSSVTSHHTNFLHLFSKSVLMTLDQMKLELGDMNSYSYSLRCAHLCTFEQDTLKRTKSIRELLETAEAFGLSSTSDQYLHLQLSPCYRCIKLGDSTQPAQMAASVAQHCRKLETSKSAFTLSCLAGIQYKLGNIRMAKVHITEAIKLQLSSKNPRLFGLADYLRRQEQYATELEDMTTATEARQRRIEIIRQINGGEIILEGNNTFAYNTE